MKRILKIIGIILLLVYFIGNVLPNLIGVPLATLHSYKAWKEVEHISNQTNLPKISSTPQSNFKNSIWVHEKDSLAGIEIKNKKWTMLYKGLETDPTDIYDYHISQSNSSEILTLFNVSDTLTYEILRLDEAFLSLQYLPSGNVHIYKAKKEDM